MDKITEKEVRENLAIIVENSHEKALNYAVNYAYAGTSMMGKELYIQVLYVLNNMSRWRGDVAKGVRDTLKQYVKENK